MHMFSSLDLSVSLGSHVCRSNSAKPARQDHVSLDVDYDDEPIILSVVIGDQCPAGLQCVKAEAPDEMEIDVT